MARYIDKELIAWVSRANARFARMARKRAAEERDSAESVKAVADRIEAQAAEIERLRDDLAKAMESLGRSKYWTATMSQAAIKAINESMLEKRRADDAEAKLAKAVQALDRIAGKAPYADDPYDIARAALSELNGDKP